jgi:xylan 1,4-beta-xylosidase
MNKASEKTKKVFEEGVRYALAGDMNAIKQMIMRNLNLEDTDENGRSILHYAVQGGNAEMVRFLVLQCQMDP